VGASCRCSAASDAGDPKESSPDPAFAKAMEAVNAKLKDPQSAHYGEMVRKVGPNLNGKPAEVVCGSVNHGYGGNRSFVYFIGMELHS
jgi:hypothetical protein